MTETGFRDGYAVFRDIPEDAERIVFWTLELNWGGLAVRHEYRKALDSDWQWGWACVEEQGGRMVLTGWTGSHTERPAIWEGAFTDEAEALKACEERLLKWIERDQERIRDARKYLSETKNRLLAVQLRRAVTQLGEQT